MKMGNSQQQQHLVRNVLNMQPQPNSDKQRQLSLNFPRSNSYEGGGQKSPSFASSPRGNQYPPSSQRGMHGAMGMNSQRSPGSSMGQNPRMSPAAGVMNYPMQRTPPISSGRYLFSLLIIMFMSFYLIFSVKCLKLCYFLFTFVKRNLFE